jgi:DNA-binding XRE family transcriptional regulator
MGKEMTSGEYKIARQKIGTQADVASKLGTARGTIAAREGGDKITKEASLALSGLLDNLRKENVEYPTSERKTWLVRFDFVLSIDGDSMAVDVEYEFENDEDMYLISIFCPDWKRNIDGTEVCDPQHDELNSEALATAKAYGLFK